LWRRSGLRNARELLDHALRDGRGEQRLSAGDGPDRGEELFGWVALQDEAAGAGP
jgi:hypothetical protein